MSSNALVQSCTVKNYSTQSPVGSPPKNTKTKLATLIGREFKEVSIY